MHIHILGIGGTFMAGVALLARAAGHRVTGSDAGLYPPMSTQLEDAGIGVSQGYQASHLRPAPDQVVIGNAMSRGNPAVEYVLNAGLDYISGPQWLAQNVLVGRRVLAVAGTHGKTTTASMLAHILNHAGLSPGYLIGGIAADLGRSAALGGGAYFVVEADEYDTAFFDKRSKFIHYRAQTLVLNNLEYDHADIFDDIEAIRRQFHHLIRTVPGNGRIIYNAADPELRNVLTRGCWSETEPFNSADGWTSENNAPDASRLTVAFAGQRFAPLAWQASGQHNASNALAAMAAARHAGVAPETSIRALAGFQGVKRRLELRGTPNGVRVFDDFAHHPTAIRSTLAGVKAAGAGGRIIAVFEPRSSTMRRGIHGQALAASFTDADLVYVYTADVAWDAERVFASRGASAHCVATIDQLVQAVAHVAERGDTVIVMSNGGFGGIHERLLTEL